MRRLVPAPLRVFIDFEDNVWRGRDQLLSLVAHLGGVGPGPTNIELNVAPDTPTRFK
jgi:hypothetical protein